MGRLGIAIAGVAVASLVGCAADASDRPAVPAPLTRPVETPSHPAPPGPIARPATVSRVDLLEVAVPMAEDGSGGVVQAPRAALAIDVTATRWPVRALDPVLHVGQIRLRRYRHVSPFVLRFVIADGASLPRDAPAFVQYGDDVGSRIDVAQALGGAP